MIVSRAVTDNLTKASWIRRMFEEGARLKAERGADQVFDFTLGNPEIEPPAAVLAAARRVLDSDARHLHAYMPNAGHPRVREAVAARLSSATGLPYTANHVLMTVGAGAALNTVLKARSEEHTSELQSRPQLVCRLLLEKKKKRFHIHPLVNIVHTLQLLIRL